MLPINERDQDFHQPHQSVKFHFDTHKNTTYSLRSKFAQKIYEDAYILAHI